MDDGCVADYRPIRLEPRLVGLALARLTSTQSDVWNTMLASITAGTRVNVSQQEIAAFLQINASYVSRAARRLKEIGLVYREVMGRHYPAMTAVQVAGLVEDEARVERVVLQLSTSGGEMEVYAGDEPPTDRLAAARGAPPQF